MTAAAAADAAVEGSRLPHLIALAGESSSEKRRLLLRELTDHFFGEPPVHTAAETALLSATKILDKAASKKVIHWKTAARNISRLSTAVNKSKQA